MWNFNLTRLYRRKPGQGFYFLLCEVERFDPYGRWVLFSVDRQSFGTRFCFFNR